jgi:hypothetical protein
MAPILNEPRPGGLLVEALRLFGLEDWHPGDLLIEVLRFCGLVMLAGGVILGLVGVLGGSPEPVQEPLKDFGLINQGSEYALIGAVLYAGSWALRRWLGRRR